MSWKYVIVTAVRDEEKHVERTIQSVLQQTVRPLEWILVDDGSTDRTGAIIDRYCSTVSWIKARHRSNRGFRMSGAGVVDAFNEGYQDLSSKDWDFVVKLDGDLSFSADYFEKCFEHFEANPKLGIGGGEIYHVFDGVERLEAQPRFHVRGATKIYRRACWEAIGGLCAVPGWDSIDELKANMLGWSTTSFPDLRLIHHRLTGTGDTHWREWVKNGRGTYATGYHPLYLILRATYSMFRRPYITGGVGMLYGFFSGYLKHAPRVDDPQLIRYVRRHQMARLLGRETIWQ
jgi:glycosyltransferase involved in cell wall biosynthesis